MEGDVCTVRTVYCNIKPYMVKKRSGSQTLNLHNFYIEFSIPTQIVLRASVRKPAYNRNLLFSENIKVSYFTVP